MKMPMLKCCLSIPLCLLLIACNQGQESKTQAPPEIDTSQIDVVGPWRAVLASPGGELPFTMIIESDEGGYQAHVLNGEEKVPFSDVRLDGRQIEFAFSWYDSEIKAEISSDASVMRGLWRKTADDGNSHLMFTATKGTSQRFLPIFNAPETELHSNVEGVWSARFKDEDGEEVAQGEFKQHGKQVSGTFLTPTGDYRFLEGSYEAGLLRLSAFDGAHAFLFTARIQDDGGLIGGFWSRDSYYADWQARRAQKGEQILPDAWELVSLTGEDNLISFSFEDVSGQQVSLSDARFAGKPVLINVFGTWCPNCNDEAPLMAQWYREYQDQGLEIIGLAFEFTGDVERDKDMVRRFAKRHGTEYPLLIAGLSDKESAAQTLGFVDKVVAFPTTFFLNRAHEVVGIHSGFNGPGTGAHYQELVDELTLKIESLL